MLEQVSRQQAQQGPYLNISYLFGKKRVLKIAAKVHF